jgi:hypothetical protein
VTPTVKVPSLSLSLVSPPSRKPTCSHKFHDSVGDKTVLLSKDGHLVFFFQRKGTIATEFPLVPKMIQNDLPPSQIGPPVWIRTRSSSLAHANRPARPFFSSGLLESPLVRHSPLFFFVSLALVDLELSLFCLRRQLHLFSRHVQ